MEGEVSQEFLIDFEEEILEAETGLELELELGESATLETDLITLSPGKEETVVVGEFDIEVFPEFGERNLNFYLEGEYDTLENRELAFGFEGELGETDYDLGMEIGDEDRIAYLQYYRRFDSGVSLRGEVEFEGGFRFNSSRIRVRGFQISLGDSIWELSGELDAGFDDSIFTDDDFLETSISLENETVRRFGLISAGEGLTFYRLELLPEEEGKSELVEVVLYNANQRAVNLKGWSIKSSGLTYEVKEKIIIGPGEKVTIHVDRELLDEEERISLVDPSGRTADVWGFPRFARFEEGLFQKEAVLERDIQIEFAGGEFDELVVDWAGEISMERGEVLFGDLRVDHEVDFREVALGYEREDLELEVSLLDSEVSLDWSPVEDEDLEVEIDLSVNGEGDAGLDLQVEQDFDVIEVENELEMDSSSEELEFLISHSIEVNSLEAEVEYSFENGEIVEVFVESTLEF